MNLLCQHHIELTQSSNTYCMRPLGHPDENVKGFPGGHNIVNEVPKIVEAIVIPQLTKEQRLLKDYGPYSTDDPKAYRGY